MVHRQTGQHAWILLYLHFSNVLVFFYPVGNFNSRKILNIFTFVLTKQRSQKIKTIFAIYGKIKIDWHRLSNSAMALQIILRKQSALKTPEKHAQLPDNLILKLSIN